MKTRSPPPTRMTMAWRGAAFIASFAAAALLPLAATSAADAALPPCGYGFKVGYVESHPGGTISDTFNICSPYKIRNAHWVLFFGPPNERFWMPGDPTIPIDGPSEADANISIPLTFNATLPPTLQAGDYAMGVTYSGERLFEGAWSNVTYDIPFAALGKLHVAAQPTTPGLAVGPVALAVAAAASIARLGRRPRKR